MNELGVRIEDTGLTEPIDRVLDELYKREVGFEPHFWLSDEWHSPDGVPGVGVPFYLAHSRLTRLERQQMFEAEGSSRESCIKYLRHEVGHAFCTAYNLHKRPKWRRLFGSISEPYPEWYRPNPRSRRFVHHLDGWYAQAHPAEDFAETFAVCLRSRSRWKKRYAGWPVMEKLEYVDALFDELAGARPRVRSRAKPFSLSRMRRTLRTFYARKHEQYAVGYSEAYDHDLLRLFSNDPKHRKNETAASFLRRNRRRIREQVAKWTGQYQFTLDQVLREMTGRCRELKLRRVGSERQARSDFCIVLTAHTVQKLYLGGGWQSL
jgi:hypothetical protein